MISNSVPNVIYDNYSTAIPMGGGICFRLKCSFRDTPTNKNATLSITALVQSYLQKFHNDFSSDTSCLKYLAATGIELGFLGNTFLLAPVETLVRLAALPIFLLLSAATYCCDKATSSRLYYTGIVGVLTSALHVGQGAVSAFYTHLAYLDNPISNRGQALCHIFHENLSELLLSKPIEKTDPN